jgi:predicted DNA-binding protein with PD1-like motif
MRGAELTPGRTFGVAFDDGEDFYTALAEFCQANSIRHGYVPLFIAGFATVEVVGTCAKLEDPRAPVWTGVHLTNVEALGGGTIAYDDATDEILPHIHVSVGLKQHSATAHTSHLLGAQVQFLTEMVIVEVADPSMRRRANPDLYGIRLLQFETPDAAGPEFHAKP